MSQESIKIHCAACGGEELSPETELYLKESNRALFTNSGLQVRFSGDGGLIFDGPNVLVDRARVCKRCGFVMTFLSNASISELWEKWEKLQSRN